MQKLDKLRLHRSKRGIQIRNTETKDTLHWNREYTSMEAIRKKKERKCQYEKDKQRRRITSTLLTACINSVIEGKKKIPRSTRIRITSKNTYTTKKDYTEKTKE